MSFKWRRKIFGSFHRLDFLPHVYLRHNIFCFSCQMGQFQLFEAGFPPTLPQYNRFGIQDIDGISNSILADCFIENTVNANEQTPRAVEEALCNFLWHKFWYLISDHNLEALLYMSFSSSVLSARYYRWHSWGGMIHGAWIWILNLTLFGSIIYSLVTYPLSVSFSSCVKWEFFYLDYRTILRLNKIRIKNI